MGLIHKLEKQIKHSTLLVPLMAILTSGCGAHRQLNMEEIFPKIKNLDTIFHCATYPVVTPDGLHWKTVLYTWFYKASTKPDWTFWYSQHKKRKEASKDCKEFFELADRRWGEYLKNQNQTNIRDRTCSLQHEQLNLKEILVKKGIPYSVTACSSRPDFSLPTIHWRARIYAWSFPYSEGDKPSLVFPFTLREDYMEAEKDCIKVDKIIEKEWKIYEKQNPHFFKNGRIIIER